MHDSKLVLGIRDVGDKRPRKRSHFFSPTTFTFSSTSSSPLHTTQLRPHPVEATPPPATSITITPRTQSSAMADWETAGAGDGVAVPQDSNDGHQDTFDTTALAGALNEADEAAFKDKAHEAGWVGTIPVNYNVQQSNREDELAAYAASSAVYEWDDEYGDVGPEVPQLEEQLFNNAFRLRQGKHMANLQLEVTVEGPNKIHPVRSVSSHSSLTTWNSTDHHTV